MSDGSSSKRSAGRFMSSGKRSADFMMEGRDRTVASPGILFLSAIAAASLIVSVSVYVAGRWSPVAIDYGVFCRAVRVANPYRPGIWFVNPPPALLFLEPL